MTMPKPSSCPHFTVLMVKHEDGGTFIWHWECKYCGLRFSPADMQAREKHDFDKDDMT